MVKAQSHISISWALGERKGDGTMLGLVVLIVRGKTLIMKALFYLLYTYVHIHM